VNGAALVSGVTRRGQIGAVAPGAAGKGTQNSLAEIFYD